MTVAELDPFSERLVGDVSRRWNEARRDHQTETDRLWLGMMLTRFTAHELEVLERAGSLSQRDRRLLRGRAQRQGGILH